MNSFVQAIEAKGGKKITSKHFPTDHSYSDHRDCVSGCRYRSLTAAGGLDDYSLTALELDGV